ncbi:hypothetical protein [Haloferax marisrubri]|uniref:Uncharacterized protein n=1 Tax=Haloferax marisrubri TaxID=1544719 RepID=A0A2P4NPL2_9EURY|nr:hypothetical protein [Haloferax marisrubri]POG55080.1 hypothetical protein AUR65_011675 [Haloferax marisrubri]
MATEDYTQTESNPQPGHDFETDLDRVGGLTASALKAGHDKEDFKHRVFTLANDIDEMFEDEAPEEAIAAAWFFILSFA